MSLTHTAPELGSSDQVCRRLPHFSGSCVFRGSQQISSIPSSYPHSPHSTAGFLLKERKHQGPQGLSPCPVSSPGNWTESRGSLCLSEWPGLALDRLTPEQGAVPSQKPHRCLHTHEKDSHTQGPLRLGSSLAPAPTVTSIHKTREAAP